MERRNRPYAVLRAVAARFADYRDTAGTLVKDANAFAQGAAAARSRAD